MYAGYEEYDVVYSISDLHLSVGGPSATSDVELLADVVRELRGASTHQRAALVLNGDIVDFLDIEPVTVFDFDGAASKLDRVFASNARFWAELEVFASEQTVVLTLGNHDIELTLPQCRAMLRKRLGPRVLLAFEGAGYRCRVGGCNVLFTHGNNEDPWNAVDLEALGAAASASAAGVRPLPWESNEGSKLVVEMLNEQKARHPFMDYLKPEGPWLLGLFERLGYGSKISIYSGMISRQVSAKVGFASRRTAQRYFLGGESEVADIQYDAEELMWDARRGARGGPGFDPSGNLGLGRASAAKPEEVTEYVRTQMQDQGRQATFEVNASDELYGALREKIGSEIHVLVCGHTHLRRAWRDSAQRAYFNTGTWLRLMDAGRASQSPAGLEAILGAFAATSRDELDEITWVDDAVSKPLVSARPTVLRLERHPDGRGLTGSLMEAVRLEPGHASVLPLTDGTVEVRP